MSDEEFVRANWEWCKVRFSEPHEGYAQGVYVVEVPRWRVSNKVESEAWAAAAEFTRERLEQIAEVEEEIQWVEAESSMSDGFPYPAALRILASREAARDDLKRGMRQ